MARESPDIPHSMRKVYRRFERWRSAHTARLPIPERLWAAAVELAREHGVSRTAQALVQRVANCDIQPLCEISLDKYFVSWLNIVIWATEIRQRKLTRMKRCSQRYLTLRGGACC